MPDEKCVQPIILEKSVKPTASVEWVDGPGNLLRLLPVPVQQLLQ